VSDHREMTINERIRELDAERDSYEQSLRAHERRMEAARLDERASREEEDGHHSYAAHLSQRASHLRRLARGA
jgi:hypothetical protein